MLIILFIILGLVFGSFVAAFSYRYPRDIKIYDGYSFCDSCGRKIEWYENIPLFSYLLLRGKCKKCKKKISTRYPIIEFATALGFLIIYLMTGASLSLLYTILIFLLLELIFIIDMEHQIIPDDFVFSGIFIVFLSIVIKNQNVYPLLLSGFIAATFLVSIFLLTKGRGMGLGDVKFAVFGGMIVGLNNLFVWMLSAFFIGAIVGIMLLASKNAKLKDKIAFGPFLITAIPVTFTIGQKILNLLGI